MKRIVTLIALLAGALLSTSAQQTISLAGADETVRLWDNSTAQHSNRETRDEKWRRKGSMMCTSSCELYIFKAAAEKNTGVAIVIYPGGSYTYLNFHTSLARWYASKGITAVMVKYRVPNYGHTEATIEDAVGVVKYLRTRGDLGIDPAKIGVSGSSAGGHLAAWTSNAMKDEEKPAFAILHYPWVDVAKSPTLVQGKALVQFLGKGYNYQKAVDLSLQNMVSATTPPTLIFLCDDDATVPSTDSVTYYEALINYGVKASIHIYQNGGHGLKKHTRHYLPTTIDWLKWLGIIEK